MQDVFDLATVLSITTGVNCTDNFGKICDLFCFMFEDESLTPTAMGYLKNIARQHIFRIHPELKSIRFDPKCNVDEWVSKQKEIFGNEITISIVGENIIKLKKQSFTSVK